MQPSPSRPQSDGPRSSTPRRGVGMKSKRPMEANSHNIHHAPAALSIPLKPTDKPVAHFPPTFYNTIVKEYATKYLEQMHALPTPDNIAMVIANMPLQKCRVSAAWKSRGCLSDVLTIDARWPRSTDPHGSSGAVDVALPTLSPRPSSPTTNDGLGRVFGTDLEINYSVEHVQWSFNDLKHRYVYPFNQIHKVPIGNDAQGYPQATSVTFSLVPERRIYQPSQAALDELMMPPSTLTFEAISQLQTAFFNVVPFDMVDIPDPKDQHLLRQHLTCPATLHLVGFLAHYLYWTVLRPLAEKCAAIQANSTPAAVSTNQADPLPRRSSSSSPRRRNSLQHPSTPPSKLMPADIEQLLVSTTESFESIKKSLAASIPTTTTKPTLPMLPLFVLSLRVAIDTIFRTTYPKWMDSSTLRIEPTLLALSNRMDAMLDPHGYYDRIGAIEASADAINFMRTHAFKMQKRRGPRLREAYFAMSTTMQSIMPMPSSGGPRRLLVEGGGGNYQRSRQPSRSRTKISSQKEGLPSSLLSLGNRLKLLKLHDDRGATA
ncbi:hypothetical protein H310_11634 [Aphanomyces invadans]|uniref:Uncharacterized protein n=1 Tax=Aphanomyces invadans TaxID=157072 RepID=A0A024TKF8_9STRA|nr:hypothetical protein H310_11634 [Aphanomyces invadans]ETV94640.1 hypothetical protein H310_11634 [Aphanomyces invadans]|eukprot:XP_008876585.1 hypothetical protein H310_11634 [Aphanomyces invadans]